MKRLSLLALLLIVTAGLASCGGGSGTEPATPDQTAQSAAPAAPKSVGACSLLTADEAKAILGEEAQPNEGAGASTVSGCNWGTSSGTGLGIMVRQATSAGEAQAVYANAIGQSQSLSGVPPQDMAGYGDKAYWAGGKLKQLNVFKDNYWVIISVFTLRKDNDPLAMAKAAADKAIPRLP